jgi:hypothetical protein
VPVAEDHHAPADGVSGVGGCNQTGRFFPPPDAGANASVMRIVSECVGDSGMSAALSRAWDMGFRLCHRSVDTLDKAASVVQTSPVAFQLFDLFHSSLGIES